MKTIFSRGEPPERMLDNYEQAALMVRCPGIERYIPKSKETLYNNFVVNIDIDSSAELEGFIKKLPGLINVGVDSATVNGKQKVSYCAINRVCVIIKH